LERPRFTRRRRVLTRVALALMGALVVPLSACGLSGYQYVTHLQSGGADLYFKIPSSWTMFDQRQLIEAANGPLSSSQIKDIEGGRWVVTFAGRHVNVSASESISGHFPTGFVEERPLSLSEQDGFSLASLRTEILSSDPLNPPDPDPYIVLSYNPFTRKGGLRGSSMVVDIKASDGTVATLNQVAMVDSKTNWVYLIAVGCLASCYGANRSVIGQIVNSWSVKEP
jgi:hypothetical protein